MRNPKLISGVALLLITGACSGEATTDQEGPSTTESTVAVITTATGPGITTQSGTGPDYTQVNGASLAYECFGSGSPAVVFEHGWAPPEASDYNSSWGGARSTLEAISEFTTACIYGRRGVMGSDQVAADARTASEQVADLSGFIDSFDFDTPVILVGYSWGGELVRLFAGENPDAVGGLVLVDSQHPEGDEAFDQETPGPVAPEMIDFATSHGRVSQVDDLGELPIYLLSSTNTFPGAPEEIQQTWDGLQAELATLSSDTKMKQVQGFNHFEIPGAAEEISAAVRDVIQRAGN